MHPSEPRPVKTITGHLVRFRETGNPVHFARAVRLTLRGGRVGELAYGAWCMAALRSSVVVPQDVRSIVQQVEGRLSHYLRQYLSVEQLHELYGDRYPTDALPRDFEGTRTESIVEIDDHLLMGEYGDPSSRIAILSSAGCRTQDHYLGVPGVRHIHAMHRHPVDRGPDGGEILVATGDQAKVLDLWTWDGERLYFQRRLRRRLTGYTAMASVGGQLYGGTDFSSRPNYIERLDGKKYPFPPAAYTMFSRSFHALKGRWLLAISSELDDLGDRNVLSIFDTETETFAWCDYLPPESSPGAARGP